MGQAYCNKENYGFSLVEIVIVVAIIALFVSIFAPQYFTYNEKSRVTTDEQILVAVHDALAVAITDENIEERPISGFSFNSQVKLEEIGLSTDKPYTEFVNEVKTYLQVYDPSVVHDKFQSNAYKGQDIIVEVDATRQTIRITVNYNDRSGAFILE